MFMIIPMDSLTQFFSVVVMVLALVSESGRAFRFDIESGHSKCISEEIKSDHMSVGRYSVINPAENQPLPDSHKLTVRLIFPNGDKYNHHYAELVAEGKFSFHAIETGVHVACFTAAHHQPSTTITVDFEWNSGIVATDWSAVAKKGSVDAMEMQLKQLYETVQNIKSWMQYLRVREEEMQLLNKETNSKMAWLSFGSILMCLMVAGMQLWHLKTFFEKKKII